MKIISGCNKIRYYDTILNHKNYCQIFDYNYEFYFEENHPNPYFIKIEKILENLILHNKVMWIDDDAFFCDKTWMAESVFDSYAKNFIVAESPPIREHVPLFNSGVMFFKKSPEIISFLKEALEISPDVVKNNYKTEWGNPVGGDQDALIYLSQTKYHNIIDIVKPYYLINARPFNYTKDLYPIVHFAGLKDRENSIKNFKYLIR